ncbi:MAG: hypothetical protein PHW10_00910 [Candidatus Peribacteraceae bacterium]|nr:hypothetical protein [Candidatus Peribacteraceae bacterium]
MLHQSDLPSFLKFLENSVAVDLGGALSSDDANLIRRVAKTTLAPHPKDIEALTMEIAGLQADPLHQPRNFHSLEIIKATKRHCKELLEDAA